MPLSLQAAQPLDHDALFAFRDSVWGQLRAVVREANRTAQHGELSGELDASLVYAALLDQIERVQKEVKHLRSHQHEWNEDDYCIHCGADGRA